MTAARFGGRRGVRQGQDTETPEIPLQRIPIEEELMVLIDWDKVAYPYLDELTPTLDAVVQRAKNDAVTMSTPGGR